jgi:hypothetical protein
MEWSSRFYHLKYRYNVGPYSDLIKAWALPYTKFIGVQKEHGPVLSTVVPVDTVEGKEGPE